MWTLLRLTSRKRCKRKMRTQPATQVRLRTFVRHFWVLQRRKLRNARCSAGFFCCVRRLGDGVAERRTTHALVLLPPQQNDSTVSLMFSFPRARAPLPNLVHQSSPLHGQYGGTQQGCGLPCRHYHSDRIG